MVEWGAVAARIESESPSVEAYSELAEIPIATAYRDHLDFRRCFPSEVSPKRILDILWDQLPRGAQRGPGLYSMPVVLDIDGPADASPCLAAFTAELLERMAIQAGSVPDRQLPPLAGSAQGYRAEAVRAYRLADRAVFEWFEKSLNLFDEGRAAGLSSLQRLRPFDTEAAGYAGEMLREYGASIAELAPAADAAARAAEAVARLRERPRLTSHEAFTAVGEAAAETLTRAHRIGVVQDVIEPARALLDELLASPRLRSNEAAKEIV